MKFEFAHGTACSTFPISPPLVIGVNHTIFSKSLGDESLDLICHWSSSPELPTSSRNRWCTVKVKSRQGEALVVSKNAVHKLYGAACTKRQSSPREEGKTRSARPISETAHRPRFHTSTSPLSLSVLRTHVCHSYTQKNNSSLRYEVERALSS